MPLIVRCVLEDREVYATLLYTGLDGERLYQLFLADNLGLVVVVQHPDDSLHLSRYFSVQWSFTLSDLVEFISALSSVFFIHSSFF